MHGDGAGGRRIASAAAIVVAIAAVGGVLPVVIAQRHGALDIPRSDDWSYLKTLFVWSRSGRWSFNGWTSMTLVGQVVLVAPVVKVFGSSIRAVDLFMAALGVAGLLALVPLGRRAGADRPAVVLVALAVAAGPLWGPLAPTFMTDVPSFALQAVALLCAARAVSRRPLSMPWLTASIVVAGSAVAIREYAAATFVAFVVVACLVSRRRADPRSLRAVVTLSIATAIVLGVVIAWSHHLPGRLALDVTLPTTESCKLAVAAVGGWLRLIGLLLVPVVVMLDPVAVVRRAWRAHRDLTVVLSLGTAALLALSYLLDETRPFVGNYVDRRGVLDDAVATGNRPLVMARPWFELLVVVGSVAAVVVVLTVVPAATAAMQHGARRAVADADPVVALLALTVAGTAVLGTGAVLVGLPVFDRYALPVVALVGLLLARVPRERRASFAIARIPALAAVALVALAALGVVFADESAAYDGSRWRMAENVVRHGYAPADVDAGYEWGGFVRGVAPPFHLVGRPTARRAKLRAYVDGTCVVVVVNPSGRVHGVIASSQVAGLMRGAVRVVALPTGRPCADGRRSPTGRAPAP